MFRVLKEKLPSEIISEWDALAHVRYNQIIDGTDITYNNILIPSIINLSKIDSVNRVLDAGCGVGILTHKLAAVFDSVIGVDPSSASINLAMNKFNDCIFINDSLENVSISYRSTFDLVVANMVLMDVLHLKEFLIAASTVVRNNGYFIFSITHPCFWPRYYGYEREPWFKYMSEFIIESPFRISGDDSGKLVSTHIHRSLSKHIDHLNVCGFYLDLLLEPMPSPEIEPYYNSPWSYPRYLLGRCKRQSSL